MKFKRSVDGEIEGVIKKSGSKEDVRHKRILATRFRLYKVHHEVKLIEEAIRQERNFLWGVRVWGL